MNYCPQDFLDINDTPYAADLFQGLTYVWEGVSALHPFLEKTVKPEIRGYVEEGAWLEPDRVFLGEGARVERGAIVRGPAIIGKNTTIRSGAYLRGHTLIGEGCLVGFCVEMRQTLLLNHSRIPHFNAVFTSLIGSNVNFGGKTCTANFRLDQKEVILKLPLQGKTVNFPTGQVLFGAVVGDETSIGGNSFLQPGTLIGRRCYIFPKCTLSRYIPHDSKVYSDEPPPIIVPKNQE